MSKIHSHFFGFSWSRGRYEILLLIPGDSEVHHPVRLFYFHTLLEHTPKRNLYQQALLSRDPGIIVGVGVFGGLPKGVCGPRVCCNFVSSSKLVIFFKKKHFPQQFQPWVGASWWIMFSVCFPKELPSPKLTAKLPLNMLMVGKLILLGTCLLEHPWKWALELCYVHIYIYMYWRPSLSLYIYIYIVYIYIYYTCFSYWIKVQVKTQAHVFFVGFETRKQSSSAWLTPSKTELWRGILTSQRWHR